MLCYVCLFVVSCSLRNACCWLFAGACFCLCVLLFFCCSLFVVRSVFGVAGCSFFVVCCLSLAVFGSLFVVARCLLFVDCCVCSLFLACRLRIVVCFALICVLFGVWCSSFLSLCVVCCLLLGVCWLVCVLFVACCVV